MRFLLHLAFLVVIIYREVLADNIDNKIDGNDKPHWITDGSPGFEINENSISSSNSDRGTKYNALWRDEDDAGIRSGSHYWIFQVEDAPDSIWIGLTDLNKFKSGWGIKGLFYGGNLADGSGLLVSQFGPRIKSGDKIGLLVRFESEKLKVYFFYNDQPLGIAYDVSEEILDAVYPVVSFYGSGTIVIEKSDQIPTNLDRLPNNFSGIEGDWKLIEFKVANEEQALPITPTLNIKQDRRSTRFRLSLRVINSIFGGLTEAGPGTWTLDIGASTRMGGPPESMQLEYGLSQGLEGVNSVEVDTNGNLIMTGNEVMTRWVRYVVEVPHVIENPFN